MYTYLDTSQGSTSCESKPSGGTEARAPDMLRRVQKRAVQVRRNLHKSAHCRFWSPLVAKDLASKQHQRTKRKQVVGQAAAGLT